MSSLNDKYGNPILEDGVDPFYLHHDFRSNHVHSHFPRLRAVRKASYHDSMLMIDILLHKYEAEYLPNEIDPNLLCFPYLFQEPPQGALIRNKTTGEVYSIEDTVKNPLTNKWEGLVRIDSVTPPKRDFAEKLEWLDANIRVRFTAEFPLALDTTSQTDQGHIDDAGPIRPTVVYALIQKEPGSIGGQPFSPQKQYKPMHRERMKSPLEPGRSVDVSAQWFDLLVQFECFTTDNYSADLLADWFEDFMRQYTWVLKYNGVQEILFWQRLRDAAVTKWRQDLISRTVQYFFRIEDLLPVVRRDLINVDTQIDLAKEIKEAGHRWIAGRHITGQLTPQEYRDLFRGTSGEFLFGSVVLNDGNIDFT
jgi:hypothetical protein